MHNLDVGYSTMNSIEELRQKAVDVEPEITEKSQKLFRLLVQKQLD
ncbi:hypothetical protein Q7352_10625 [Glaesserella parasuis]|nr:hypothetical protein [Glaesserella parasuis]MDO9931726.1 hypothetical protein [Glaesserella parasuis]MDP0020978.1 hypothetical protein [Glaesserella parasuis]MDP0129372.1 hypothetical protein [Glaesserella parasuis]MDP0142173.1 hypothetical protein [Glaesserella parasuis]